MNKHLDDNFYDTSTNSDKLISLKYPLYSAILPGLGEYKIYKETLIFNHKINHKYINSASVDFVLNFYPIVNE